MENKDTNKVREYLNVRVTETMERDGEKRYLRKRLFYGERLLCEIFVDETSPFMRRIDYPKVLNDFCTNITRVNPVMENNSSACKQLSDAIDLLEKLERIHCQLPEPFDSSDFNNVLGEYRTEIFRKGAKCLKILFPEAAQRLRGKDKKVTL